MRARLMLCGALVAVGVLIGRMTTAQAPQGQINEQELLNNDSVRVVLVTYQPGADSDLLLNLGPEITIIQEGELGCMRREDGRPSGRVARTGSRRPRLIWPATRESARSSSGPSC